MTVVSNTAVALPGVAPTITPGEAERMIRVGHAYLVDVRERDEVRREHVKGALLCPTSTFSAETFPPPRDGQRALVMCRSGTRAGRVAAVMRAQGRSDVLLVEGGILAWQAAGLPVVIDTKAPMPMQRQVMLTVGMLLLGFTVMTATLSPWFLLGIGFLGAGLTFAGATGICGLAAVLGWMPWNRLSPPNA